MKTILLMVSSLNGKATRGKDANIYAWTSKEDSKLFFDAIDNHNLIVMGRKTYEAAKRFIRLKRGTQRIVLTSQPDTYKSQERPGMLEFSSESPKGLVNRLSGLGYSDLLLVGGERINTAFLKDELIDEIHLTIEPMIFGQGHNLFLEEHIQVPLRLIDVKKLNAKGTLHLRYSVLR